MGITHKFISATPDGPDASEVRPSNWNDDHDIDVTGILAGDAATDQLTGIVASGANQYLRRNLANTAYEFANLGAPVLASSYNFSRAANQAIASAGVYTFDLVTIPLGVSGYIFAPSYTITGAVNNGSGLVRLTTSVPHTLETGMVVVTSGVGGVAGANGTFKITKVSYLQFDLQASTFAGVYTTGGTAQQRPQYLYLSGGSSTAEACPVVSVSGTTVSLFVSSAKGGNYTITSATGGLQEALYDSQLNIALNIGDTEVYATFTVDGNFHPTLHLSGNNQLGSNIVRGAYFLNGDVIRLINNCGPLLENFAIRNSNLVQIASGAAISGRNQISFSTRITNLRILNEKVGLLVSGSNRYFCDNLWITQDVAYSALNNSIAGIQFGDGPWNSNADCYFVNIAIQGAPPQLLSPGQYEMFYGILIEKGDGIYFVNGNSSARAGIWFERATVADTINYVLFSNFSVDNCGIFSLGILAGNTVGGPFQNIRFSNCSIQQSNDDTQPQIVLSGNQFYEGGVQFNNCYIASSAAGQVYISDASYVTFSDVHFRNINYDNVAGGYAVNVQGTLSKKLVFDNCDWDYTPSFTDYSKGILISSDTEGLTFTNCRIHRAVGSSCLTFQEGFDHEDVTITSSTFSNSSVYGIYFNGTAPSPSTVTGLVLTGNLFSGNTSASIATNQYVTFTRTLIDNNSLQETTPDSVVAAATISLPYTNFLPIVIITGNTNIVTINNTWGWKKVTLRFTGTPSLTAAGNIAIASGPYAAGRAITLQYDPSSSKWYLV